MTSSFQARNLEALPRLHAWTDALGTATPAPEDTLLFVTAVTAPDVAGSEAGTTKSTQDSYVCFAPVPNQNHCKTLHLSALILA